MKFYSTDVEIMVVTSDGKVFILESQDWSEPRSPEQIPSLPEGSVEVTGISVNGLDDDLLAAAEALEPPTEDESSTEWVIVSDRWSQDRAEVTMSDLEDQAEQYTRDRLSRSDGGNPDPVTLRSAARSGCAVLLDDTDDVVAVAIEDIRRWDGDED